MEELNISLAVFRLSNMSLIFSSPSNIEDISYTVTVNLHEQNLVPADRMVCWEGGSD